MLGSELPIVLLMMMVIQVISTIDLLVCNARTQHGLVIIHMLCFTRSGNECTYTSPVVGILLVAFLP